MRANPTNAVGASLRLEYNQEAGEFETIQANGTYNVGDWLQTTGGWSQRKYLQIVDPLFRPPNNFLSSRTNVNLGRSHIGGAYHFDLNLSDKTLVQQRIGFFYNAQCCGVGDRVPGLQLPQPEPLHRVARTAASTSRSRWPASAPSRTSSAPSASDRARPA